MRSEFAKRWWLVAWTAVIVGTITTIVLAIHGATQQGMHLVLRSTGRTSLVLFLAVFVASPLHATWPSRATRWLLENRRYLGVSFATSHTVHFAAIIALTRVSPQRPDPVVVVFGGIGYAFILAMAATSFDTTAAWLGKRRWKRLHTAGVYYIWSVFTLTALGGVIHDPLSLFSVSLLGAALLLRLAPSPPRALQGVAGGGVRRVRPLVWLLAVAVATVSSACLAMRRRASPECLPDPEVHCRSQCGRYDAASAATPEGRCEATVGDLCRAHCLEACGDHSSSLAKRIEAYESSLDHDCGSGEPIGPGETPPPPVVPTPHPLDRWLREACVRYGRTVSCRFSTNGDG